MRRIKNLLAIPGIVAKVSRLVENPETSAAEVGRLISQDQLLSAKVLCMANSAFFGMSRKISSIPQALAILGYAPEKHVRPVGTLHRLRGHFRGSGSADGAVTMPGKRWWPGCCMTWARWF